MIRCLVFLAMVAVPAAAAAQDVFPDMKGSWSIESQSIKINRPDGGEPWVGTITARVDIDWQDGNRFHGREVDQNSSEGGKLFDTSERIIGVIGMGGKTAYISDENGFRDCWIMSADRFECVYRHIQDDQSAVAWNVWTRAPR